MKIQHLAFFLFFIVLVYSCKGEEDNADIDSPVKEKTEEEKLVDKNVKQIEVLFDEVQFDDKSSLSLLRELGEGICNPAEKDLENFMRPACNSKFFKFFPYKKDTKLKDAFLLLIKSNVHGFPIRRTFVYQRENGKLVKVNGFAANLIEMRKNKGEYEDLILRFNDEFQNHFNCKYVWRANHYEFDMVEEINDSKVKKELQDSMNIEIQKELELKNLQKI